MIGGFIVEGTGPKRVIIRALALNYTQYGIPDALANPTSWNCTTGAEQLIATNDDWQTTILGANYHWQSGQRYSEQRPRSDCCKRVERYHCGPATGTTTPRLCCGVNNTATVIWYMNNNVDDLSTYGPRCSTGWNMVPVADFNGMAS